MQTITYEAKRLIKIFDLTKENSVSYLIKTVLEIMIKHKKIEVHVLMSNKKRKVTTEFLKNKQVQL